MWASRANGEKSLSEWVDGEIARGVPRGPLHRRLGKALDKTKNVEQMQALWAAIGRLEDIFADRNNDANKLEGYGQVDDAIALYEANLSDRYDGRYPYDRLYSIYARRHDYSNAIRVCRAYTANIGRDPQLYDFFWAEIKRLSKITKSPGASGDQEGKEALLMARRLKTSGLSFSWKREAEPSAARQKRASQSSTTQTQFVGKALRAAAIAARKLWLRGSL